MDWGWLPMGHTKHAGGVRLAWGGVQKSLFDISDRTQFGRTWNKQDEAS
jgi:hypothetical protein